MPYTSTVLITGGSSGLGYDTARQIALARPDVQVVVAARTGPDAATRLNSTTGQSNVLGLKLDLSSQAAVRTFVTEYLALNLPPIESLLMNAGHQTIEPDQKSPDGIELMFATNHVGHALLFYLLQDHLMSTARIVIVGSSGHDPKYKRFPPPFYITAEKVAHPPTGKQFSTMNAGFTRYGMSKLCQIMWGYALDRHIRAAGKQWTVNSYDPGVLNTGLYRWQKGIFGWAFSILLGSWLGRALISETFTVEYSATSLAKLTIDPKFNGVTGKYFRVVNVDEIPSSDESYIESKQEDLYSWTLEAIAKGDEYALWSKL